MLYCRLKRLQKHLPLMGILIVCICWGLVFPLSRIALGHVSYQWIVYNRYIIAGMLFLILLVWKRSLPHSFRDMAVFAMLAFLYVFLAPLLQTAGLKYVQGGIAGCLSAFSIILAPFLAVKIGERLSGKKIAALLTGFSGIVLISFDEMNLHFDQWPGIVLLLASATIVAVNSVAQRLLLVERGYKPFEAAAYLHIFGVLIYLIKYGFTPLEIWQGLSLGSVFAVLFLGVASSFIATILFFAVLKEKNIFYVSMFLLLVPVTAIISGWILLGEQQDIEDFAGIFLVLGSIAVYHKIKRQESI